MKDEFDNALGIICKRIREPLSRLPDAIKHQVQEIRIRANMPLCVTIDGKNRFISALGQANVLPDRSTVICDKIDVAQTFQAACEYSVYAYQEEINRGFVTISGGDRIGICGTAVTDKGCVKTVKNISSLNIRIAREHKFCASKIIEQYKISGLLNTVIIGAPSSGKTTLLRDIIYQLSSGKAGYPLRVCAVDERLEICAQNGSISPFDLGPMCDVLSGFYKSDGILCALRTLNPQVIVFDEISTEDELSACAEGFAAGAAVITSLHSSGVADFCKRRVSRRLIASKIFDCFVFLGNIPGQIEQIMTQEEITNESHRYNSDMHNSGDYRLYNGF